jgi:hypothetical protein
VKQAGYRLIDEAASSHEPVFITGKRSNAVLVVRKTGVHPETLMPLSIPGMRSHCWGLKTPVEKCAWNLTGEVGLVYTRGPRMPSNSAAG